MTLCSSTKKLVSNDKGAVKFACPQCGKFEIVRSSNARAQGIKYTCPCGEFIGPNW